VHALARVRQSRAAGLLEEPLRVLAAELERLPQSRHLGLGRVSQGEPEQLVVGEALERALQSSTCSDSRSSNRNTVSTSRCFPETATFPCLVTSDAASTRRPRGTSVGWQPMRFALGTAKDQLVESKNRAERPRSVEAPQDPS